MSLPYRLGIFALSFGLSACELGGTSNESMKVLVAAKKDSDNPPPPPPKVDPPKLKPSTPPKPTEICGINAFLDIRKNLGGWYKLVCPVNFSSAGGPAALRNWEPLGNAATPFTGRLDGNNQLISKFEVTDPNRAGETALFGVSNGLIENLKLSGPLVLGAGRVAALVAHQRADGVVRNVKIDDATVGGGAITGGIVGTNEGVIGNSEFDGNLTELMRPVGVDAMGAAVQHSLISGAREILVGGIAGRSKGTNARVIGAVADMDILIERVIGSNTSPNPRFHQFVGGADSGVTFPITPGTEVTICVTLASGKSIVASPAAVLAENAPPGLNCAESTKPTTDILPETIVDNVDVLRGGIVGENKGIVVDVEATGRIGYRVTQ